MQLICASCKSTLVKKNGHISNGKQNYQCLLCKRQFVENSTQKLIDGRIRELVRKTLLERVSLLGICRIFDISMPWLLEFLQSIFEALPDDLCAKVDSCDESDVEIVELEADEIWSFVGSKENRQWIWLAIHRPSRQIIAMHAGPRTEASAAAFYEKLPVELKKNALSILISCKLMPALFLNQSTFPQLKVREKQTTLRDLIARSDNVVLD
jgi:hypothetical protein